MRRGILEAVEGVLEEKLTESLGTGRHERGQARRGDRNGHRSRRITTAVGAQALDDPRGGIVETEGSGQSASGYRARFLNPTHSRLLRSLLHKSFVSFSIRSS
jgi:hypothetical protein